MTTTTTHDPARSYAEQVNPHQENRTSIARTVLADASSTARTAGRPELADALAFLADEFAELDRVDRCLDELADYLVTQADEHTEANRHIDPDRYDPAGDPYAYGNARHTEGRHHGEARAYLDAARVLDIARGITA